ncbi:uncharacterized protein qin isoform X1 [Drosophila montana]|uniref:uncharacterized protein qin isoform X1 n=1 Tax=Drosophila montana TaxID=40370 RepID=UPI00313DEBCC
MITDDSGVKFFDRKFVAANLRSQLRCPKCTREYSHKHTKGVAAENHRPFLLPCGHNMCEFCISKHRQQMDFKCAVCFSSAQPTISAKDPNGKYVGNIRDYYELNYHVLGETNSLEYYRRYSVDAVNNSLVCPSNMSDIVLETKCSECGHCAAGGECKQCNAFYCKRCFETVHHHSRVLKTHVFQRLVDKKRASKGIRVGNDIFRMPVQLLCSAHNAPAHIYCTTCKRTSCDLCVTRHHGNHITCTVGEMNHRYVTEIPTTINSIDAALMQINNARLVVKNTKDKLGNFAAETLDNITERFRLLHGQLQNAQLQAIEMLRESSLSPQVQLNMAMSQLNGYESVLKNLRQILHSGIDARFEVPQDIWLKDVIVIINEHLEKIPTYVKVTSVKNNPYHLKATNNLSELIEQHFECHFVDPKIKVHFNNEYDHQSTISESSQPRNSHDSSLSNSWPDQKAAHPAPATGLAHSKKQKRRPKKTKSSSSSMNSNIGEHQDQQHNFVHTFSAMDISKSNSIQSASNKIMNHMADWFHTDAMVRVRSIQSPEDFYVQCIQAAQRIREQLETFAETPACKPPEVIVVGQQYITCHSQTEMDRWHRALVSQKAEMRDIYNVFLPDIGLSHMVHSNNFRRLPDHLATLPYAAVHCTLKQLMPSKGGTEWEPQAGAFLKQMVQNNPVHITVLGHLGRQPYEVDLITNNYGSNISVRESFLYTGMARARGLAAAQLPQLQQLVALQSQRLPKFVPHVGDVLIIQMLHVEHPQEFYVMPHELELKRCTLQRELQCFMDHMSLSQLEPIYLGRLQLGCVLQSEGQWQRACIEHMLPEGYVLVRLVDSGISQKLYWDQLFMLPHKFWTQELAIKCCLADVETLQEHNYAWTPAAIDAFKQLTSNPKLQMEVVCVRDKVAHVAVHFTRSGNEQKNVGAMLVAQGHCQSSGESSKVIKPQPGRHSHLDADTRKLIEEAKLQLEPSMPAKTSDRQNRSQIEVLHVEHPGEFYVTLTHFVSAHVQLRKTVQVNADKMYQTNAPKLTWQPGDMCYVRVMAKGDLELLWHRGQIVGSTQGANSKYNVRLRDIGELALGVPINSMAIMDEDLGRVSNSALCCRLSDIIPNGAEWSPEVIEFFKTQLQAYSTLHVTGHGKDGGCTRVILWGAHTEISGPFSPARIKYTNINELFLQTDRALRDPQMLLQQDLQLLPSSSSRSSSQGEDDDDDPELLACLEKVGRTTGSVPLPQDSYFKQDFEHNDEMPPLELLKDLNINAPTTGCTEPPLAWLQPRQCKKSIFTALPTYVNHQCEVYLSLASDESFIHHMRNLLVKHFKPLLEKQKPSTYVVGQPVVVVYHLDNLFYRGIVQSKLSPKGEHKVYYVDYGNEEKVKPAQMLPYAPFPQLSSLCWRVAIHGVQPKQKNYTSTTMDTVHQTVVMKLSSVRVVETQGVNGLPQCQLKVGDMDIATMMLNNEMAVRVPPRSDHESKQNRAELLKLFKVFDELKQLGEYQPPMMGKQANTTAQPPPTKKKYMMDSREMQQVQRLDCQNDFDCKEAAKQKLQTSVDFEKGDSDADDADEKNSTEGFSDDYVIEKIDEGISNDDDDHTASPVTEQASFIPPQGISAMDQMRRRIQLRYKQDRLESAHFSPMDTSTERSYHDGDGGFKPQCLPTGVKQFTCSIDRVLSATELQISPKLTEFAKQEIALAQETSALIKEAAQLNPVQLKAKCLARYSRDSQWYRAVIIELHQAANKATVYYIDFHDTEMLPFNDLKVMPNHLLMFPQQSVRVKLYGIKLNRNFADTSVRQALQACLCKYPSVFARVHYPNNYHDNSDDYDDSDPGLSSDFIRHGFKLMEVDIYENKYKTDLLYKPLIDSRMFVLK